ncbi:MAG: C45 family autoproteolytic acyltransferase/hydrolase [Candidatus Geothermincolia bacterium]
MDQTDYPFHYGSQEVILFEFGGDHYEIGFNQGLQLRQYIEGYFATLESSEAFRVMRPAYLPMRAYLTLETRRAVMEVAPDLQAYYPSQRRKMDGLAKGSELSEAFFYLAAAQELSPDGVSYRLGACTAIGVAPERSALGEPMVIKNYDGPREFQPYYSTLHYTPEDGYENIAVTIAGQVGCHDGINRHGLVVSCNAASGTDLPKVMVPTSILVQETLERCRNVEEAVGFLERARRGSGALILLADAEGHVASVELSPNFEGRREAESGVLINTNHYRTPELKPYDIPRNAYYTNRNVRALRGIRIHESSELRYERAELLLQDLPQISVRDLVSVVSDHGEGGRGSENTICRHEGYFWTTSSMIFLPASRRMLVTYGNPCDSTYTEFRDPFRGGADLQE